MAAKTLMRGTTGYAGDHLGFGPQRPGYATRVVRLNGGGQGLDTVVEEAGVIHGEIVAGGEYCQWPKTIGQGEEPSRERRLRGDLVWGDWVVTSFEGDRQMGGARKPTVVTGRGWHRADRIAPLAKAGVLTQRMVDAANNFAQDAERAEMVGLRCTFGTMKVDGSGGFKDAAIDEAGAGERVRRAMAMLGGSSSLLGGTCWLVVVCGFSLQAIEQGARWAGQDVNRKELRGLLRAGLDILSRVY